MKLAAVITLVAFALVFFQRPINILQNTNHNESTSPLAGPIPANEAVDAHPPTRFAFHGNRFIPVRVHRRNKDITEIHDPAKTPVYGGKIPKGGKVPKSGN